MKKTLNSNYFWRLTDKAGSSDSDSEHGHQQRT